MLLAAFAWLFAADFVKPLQHMTAVVSTMAEGDIDLERRMRVASQDEIGTLAAGFNVMLQHLAGLVRRVQQTGIEVTSSATQLAASGKQLESRMTEQVASTHEVVATTQEIAATSQELARTMQDVTTLSDDTATAAASSQAGLSQMATTMQQMEAATRTIAEKLSAIQQRAARHHQRGHDDHQGGGPDQPAVAQRRHRGREGRRVRPGLRRGGARDSPPGGPDGGGDAGHRAHRQRDAGAVSAGVMGMDKFAHEVQQGVEQVRTVGRNSGRSLPRCRR